MPPLQLGLPESKDLPMTRLYDIPFDPNAYVHTLPKNVVVNLLKVTQIIVVTYLVTKAQIPLNKVQILHVREH